MKRNFLFGFIAIILTLVLVNFINAQTSAFVYQGKLQDGGIAANGTYQFEFKIFDAASGGNQIGETLADVSATVSGGIFAVNLDFGVSAFDGAARYLEIGVRLNGSGQNYTTLNPRQRVTSTPYAVKSLTADQATTATTADNAANLGGVPAAQYVVTNDARMTDARDPLPGSANYVQNSTSQQSNSNFNVSGEGKAFKLTSVIVNATSEYQQSGSRVMQFVGTKSGYVGLFTGTNATGTNNMFVGFEAGKLTTSGSFNSFLGSESGKENTTGFNNSFFGGYSGRGNQTGANNAFFGANTGLTSNGNSNSFFGSNAGFANTSGSDNSFFGNAAGLKNKTGLNNSLFGRTAGANMENAANNSFFGAFSGENTMTGGNSFFGAFAGQKNSTGSGNVFVGLNAGKENTGGTYNTFVGTNTGQNAGAVGNYNTVVGYNAKVATSVSNATAIGANALASQSNSLVLGTAFVKTFIPGELSVSAAAEFENNLTVFGTASVNNLNVQGNLLTDFENSTFKLKLNGTLEAGSISAGGAIFDGILKADSIGIKGLFNGGTNPLCYVQTGGLNDYYQAAKCSSSRRYKENIRSYTGGLSVVRRLRPVTFSWKSNNQEDIGFVAEEIAETEPLLATYNPQGQIEGVKYAQVTTVLVNAVKEQQAQIEKLEEQVKQQNNQIKALKMLVCQSNPTAESCQISTDYLPK